MTEGKKFELHRDSSMLFAQLKELGVYPYIRKSLEMLDADQESERISPYLADTVRDMIFQAASEGPDFVNELVIKTLDGGIRYIATQLEGAGYRLRKSAELVTQNSVGIIDSGDVIAEYLQWQHSDMDDMD
jgi:hypothetical protein